MSRTDYYHDPHAPTPNSVVVAASTFVRDNRDRVLLIRRSDNGLWTLPGGIHEIGETVAQTAVRETFEETGLHVEVTAIVGVYSDPAHVIAYNDGEVRQQFNLCLRARLTGGTIRTSAESTQVRWINRDELKELAIHPAIRLRIDHGFADQTEPHIG
jgi:ADP-ribose pyrophosphatase YjhB (NUDIX family)